MPQRQREEPAGLGAGRVRRGIDSTLSFHHQWHPDCSANDGVMRVRILRKPPQIYDDVTATLRVGRVYNLDAAVASALLYDGVAESYDVLSMEEKRRKRAGADDLWQAADRERWFVKSGNGEPESES